MKQDPLFDKYYTAAEVCRILKVDKRTLLNWRKARHEGFVWVRLGSAIRYPRRELIRWIELNTIKN